MKVRGRSKTTQTTVLLRSDRILTKVLEIWTNSMCQEESRMQQFNDSVNIQKRAKKKLIIAVSNRNINKNNSRTKRKTKSWKPKSEEIQLYGSFKRQTGNCTWDNLDIAEMRNTQKRKWIYFDCKTKCHTYQLYQSKNQ